MRLLVHNLLQCTSSSTAGAKCKPSTAYPLIFSNVKSVIRKEAEFNAEFIESLIVKIDYPVLISTLKALNASSEANLPNLPASLPEQQPYEAQFLQDLHVALLETVVEEGDLNCQGCGHCYPIRDGIVNMLHQEQ